MLTPEQAVDSINARFGRHAGYRALHAKGVVCRGTFTASPAATALTRAAHMQGKPVDVTARFSNGSGDPGAPDHDVDVRGMAVKFNVEGVDTAPDIVSQSSPRFPVRTPDDFITFVHANAPGVARLWKLPAFLATHRTALAGLRDSVKTLRPPASYASIAYYATHAFKWINADGDEHWVRYTWVPGAPQPSLSPREARKLGADYLQREMGRRLGGAPARFTLRLQVAAPGDPTEDPTAAWPEDREKVDAGTLEVTALAPEREGPDTLLVFDPVHVVDGIELSDDPILHFRPRAYSVSIERRMASR